MIFINKKICKCVYKKYDFYWYKIYCYILIYYIKFFITAIVQLVPPSHKAHHSILEIYVITNKHFNKLNFILNLLTLIFFQFIFWISMKILLIKLEDSRIFSLSKDILLLLLTEAYIIYLQEYNFKY